MFLPAETFRTVVDATPLISIDLVVKNSKNEVLLGKRLNRPAQNYWFVPGGRIMKNESLNQALVRLCKEELGLTVEAHETTFLGPYEHFYEDSIFDSVSTHYVVLAYTLAVDIELDSLPQAQHASYKWFTAEAVMHDDYVHQHTKWYLC